MLSLFAVDVRCQTGQEPAPPAASSTFDFVPAVPYAQTKSGPLVADLYLPHGKGPFPGIVFIHGGGWWSGDRTQLRRQAEFMAQRGFVGMAIEYRLAPASPYPAALEDAREAVAWLRQHAVQYHVAGSRIGAVGSSAGGHLAALLGVESPSGSTNASRVSAVVILNGIFNLVTMPPTKMISDFVSGPCLEREQVCRDASPVNHVRENLPPFLIMHGNADQTAPYDQATSFQEKMLSAHNRVDFYTAEGGPHTFWSKPAWSGIALEKMATFLEQQLASPLCEQLSAPKAGCP